MTSSFAASKLEKQASGSEIVIGVENESGEKTAVDIDDATEDTEDHVQGESFYLNRFSAIFKKTLVEMSRVDLKAKQRCQLVIFSLEMTS